MVALPSSPLVSVEDYQKTSYDPDVEFVDGVLAERNVGEWLHSLIQSNVLFALGRKYPHLKVVAALLQGEIISTADLSVELSGREIFAD